MENVEVQYTRRDFLRGAAAGVGLTALLSRSADAKNPKFLIDLINEKLQYQESKIKWFAAKVDNENPGYIGFQYNPNGVLTLRSVKRGRLSGLDQCIDTNELDEAYFSMGSIVMENGIVEISDAYLDDIQDIEAERESEKRIGSAADKIQYFENKKKRRLRFDGSRIEERFGEDNVTLDQKTYDAKRNQAAREYDAWLDIAAATLRDFTPPTS